MPLEHLVAAIHAVEQGAIERGNVEQEAMQEVGFYTNWPRHPVSAALSDASRPPSYATVSNSSQAIEETARKARAANFAHETDCKSVVSDGDRRSVDETEVKTVGAKGVGESVRQPLYRTRSSDSDSSYQTCGDNDDIYYDASSGGGTLSDLMQAIEDLQQRQDNLTAMHAEHDRKLEELLRKQPVVKIIRQNSVRGPRQEHPRPKPTKTKAQANKSTTTNNSSNSSSSDSRCFTKYENYGSETGNEAVASRDTSPGEAPPQDLQVTHRKPSKGGVRDDIAMVEFQRLQQSQIYVQLERLYSNFQRLHIPSKTMQNLMESSLVADPTRLQAACGRVTTLEQLRDDEKEKLRRENEELKKRNGELQKNLEQVKRDKEAAVARRIPPPLPPKPTIHSPSSNASRGRPRLQNTKLHARQLEFVSGRPTSPRPPPARPVDIDVREISIQHKIESYRDKFDQEVLYEGRKQVSSSFYTTHGGCRAQLEVFLDGNGTGRGRCMSLFVRVVPGEFDEFIKWPITLRIRATLMNQNHGLSHSVEDSAKQFQFSKPKSFPDSDNDYNCWGLVEFVDHKMISQPGFIKDDAIVLRCKITFPSFLD